ncbi:MAG: hypothetical protein BroJett029_21920 [Alphaproteobacteria bacterium]|nr:MAG: hypothetical protein BroJett029_21920 [Alphaproteobacteria bacterium]
MILVRHGQSLFNVHYARTRRDPGIPDPPLTEEGRRQARCLAEELRGEGVRRLIASPYTRALETASIIAELLELPLTVEVSVREHAAFVCDIGTPARELAQRWPALRFDHIEDPWWPPLDETEAALRARAQAFRRAMCEIADWREVAVVSHWGFIRALTGVELANCQSHRFDPTGPD